MLVAYLYWYANTQMKCCTSGSHMAFNCECVHRATEGKGLQETKTKGLATGGTYRKTGGGIHIAIACIVGPIM